MVFLPYWGAAAFSACLCCSIQGALSCFVLLKVRPPIRSEIQETRGCRKGIRSIALAQLNIQARRNSNKCGARSPNSDQTQVRLTRGGVLAAGNSR